MALITGPTIGTARVMPASTPSTRGYGTFNAQSPTPTTIPATTHSTN